MDRATFQPSPLAETQVRGGDDGGWTLVFVRDLRHPRDKVWAALTDPARLGEWAPYTADRDLGSTGPVTLTMIDGEATEDLHTTVTRADPPELLEYDWGGDALRWQLADNGAGGTRLTLHHTLKDRTVAPKAAAGWHLCLDVADALLAGTPVGPIRGEEARQFGWDDLNQAYAATLDIPTDNETPS
jgi:uncharacterized protein YndB with AHSA1/START domain